VAQLYQRATAVAHVILCMDLDPRHRTGIFEYRGIMLGLVADAGPRPTLIEWDTDVPDWPVLAAEAARAARLLERVPA